MIDFSQPPDDVAMLEKICDDYMAKVAEGSAKGGERGSMGPQASEDPLTLLAASSGVPAGKLSTRSCQFHPNMGLDALLVHDAAHERLKVYNPIGLERKGAWHALSTTVRIPTAYI